MWIIWNSNTPLNRSNKSFSKGDRLEVDDRTGHRWIRNNVALSGEIKQQSIIKPTVKIDPTKISLGFVTYAVTFTGNSDPASTRIRVRWAVKHNSNFIMAEDFKDLVQCNGTVFQTRFAPPDIALAKRLKQANRFIIFDLTDPQWDLDHYVDSIDGNFAQMVDLADLVTVPTQVLKDYFLKQFPSKEVSIIKDRIDLDVYDKIKLHRPRNTYQILWTGSYCNLCSMELARNDLERLGKEFSIKLLCIYDQINNYRIKPFDNIKVETMEWTHDLVINELLKSDLSINPKFDNHWKSYKSDNKTMMAWSLGVPCVERNFYKEIKKYLNDHDLRNREANVKRAIIEKEYDSKLTMQEWEECAIKLSKKLKQEEKMKEAQAKATKNIVLYTSIIGGYDKLKENQFKDDKVDYIAFTDQQPTNKSVWQIKQPYMQFIDTSRQAKIYKVLPWLYMPDYEYSIWMDGCVELKVSPSELIKKYLIEPNVDIAMFNHHCRDDIYEEYKADEKFLHRKEEPEYLFKMQVDKYKQEGFPEHSGLYECTFILRRHSDIIKQAMLEWWGEISGYTVCDQVSFKYVMNKHNIKVNILPGNILNNQFFTRVNHMKGYGE
jgi:hypothetical protein